MHKNAGTIRGIQDRYECCGLHSAVDKAWPFPDKTHGVKACQEAYGRQQSCMGQWTTNARGILITFTAIGAASLALKVSFMLHHVLIRASNKFDYSFSLQSSLLSFSSMTGVIIRIQTAVQMTQPDGDYW